MSDFTDDMETRSAWFDMQISSKNREWRKGYHTTKSGERVKLSDMEPDHLRNTIKYFNRHEINGYDTAPLEDELKKRNQRTQNE
jgi:hypothetical protein